MSDKLQREINKAEKDNMGNKGKEKAKEKLKSKSTETAKKGAKKGLSKGTKGAKKMAKGAHKALAGKSSTYAKGAKMLAKAASMLKNSKMGLMLAKAGMAAGKLIVFLVSNPIGWIIDIIIILIIIGIMSTSGDDKEADIDDAMGSNELAGSEEVEEGIYEREDENFQHYYTDGDEDCEPKDDGSDPEKVDDGDYGGDWLDEDSDSYENAKETFEIWTDAGLSGASAAGVVGWINSEGGFAMFGRAEGIYSSDDPEDASLAHGNKPTPSTDNYDVGGGGTYQFTPYTKYAELDSPDWEDAEKMHEYLFDMFANDRGSAWMPQGGNDMTGGDHSFEEFAEEDDPEEAVLMWNSYERADQSYVDESEKKEDAKAAYEAFGGEDIDYDEKRFEAAFGDKSEDYDADSESTSAAYDECDPSNSSGGSWGSDGGEAPVDDGMWVHPEASGSEFDGKEELPEEMMEYAMDPESVGLGFGKGDDWENKWHAGDGEGGQCTHLTSNLAERLWEDDEGEGLFNQKGNGADVVGNISDKYGAQGETSDPSAGDIFSTTEGSAMCGDSKCGHTGIVSHVFDNGDFLVVETNIGGYSGDGVGAEFTYSYRMISKDDAKKTYTFYDPSEADFKMASGVKSLK